MHASIYEDTNNLGYYNSYQPYLGTDQFNIDEGVATITFLEETIVPAGGSKNYIVVLKTDILQHKEGDTFRHSIQSLTGEIKTIGTPVTGTYGIKTTLSPLITYYPNQYYFLELNSENGLMSWVTNATGYPTHGEMVVNGAVIENTSLTHTAFLGCGVDDTKTVGLSDCGEGQYPIKINQPIRQSFITSREDFSTISVKMRSTQNGGTDNITMTLRKGTFDGEIVGQDTIAVTPTTSEKHYAFVLNDCEGDTICGNYILETGEECDTYVYNKICLDYEGFYSGSLSCTGGCTISTFNCNTKAEDLKANCTSAGQEFNSFACIILNDNYGTEYIDGLFTFNGTCDANLDECEVAEIIIPPTDPVDNNTPIDNNTPLDNDPTEPPTTDPIDSPQNNSDLQAVCGNGIIELGEYCEVGDLQGASCTDFDYNKGVLGCNSNCNYDTSNCIKVNEKGEVIATGSTEGDNLVDNNLQTGLTPNETNLEEEIDLVPFAVTEIIIIIILIGIIYYFTSIKSKIKIAKKK